MTLPSGWECYVTQSGQEELELAGAEAPPAVRLRSDIAKLRSVVRVVDVFVAAVVVVVLVPVIPLPCASASPTRRPRKSLKFEDSSTRTIAKERDLWNSGGLCIRQLAA